MNNINISKQIVHTTGCFTKDDSFDDERFCRVRVAAMHTGINRNKSRFSKKTVEKAKDTFKNIPVLADIIKTTDEDGNVTYDYQTHGMHEEDDAFHEGEKRIIYDEKIVGVVPETNNFELVYDDETKNWYAYVDAFLYRDYGNYACDILEKRGNRTDVSMEIGCDDISYSTKDNCIDVGKMTAGAITLLGENVAPGMVKAHAEVFDSNESKQNELLKVMQDLKESLDRFTFAHNHKDEGKEESTLDKEKTKLEEEEILETETAEETADQTEEVTGTAETEQSEQTETQEITEAEEQSEEPTTENEQFSAPREFDENGNMTIKYSISHEDIRAALYGLIGQFEELDNDYYCINTVYDDKFVMQGWMTGNLYGCKYTKDGDNVALDGERYRLYAEYVTETEKAELESMRANYSSIQEKLATYETAENAAKVKELLESKDYAGISNTEEFAKIKKDSENAKFEDIKQKCDELLLTYAKAGKLSFAAVEEPIKKATPKTLLPDKKARKKGRYGSLFS